ncbi:hypothetical protein [Piscinibacter sakaiensis]|uniref:hypothetical protein n=1 Tax=Piscinibacter sakaiensis TaxID=1547922 RepID=UPI003AABE14A
MKLAAAALALLLTSACATGVPDLEIALVERTCSQWCIDKHPKCAFTGAIVEPKTDELRACHKSFISCVRSCPPR